MKLASLKMGNKISRIICARAIQTLKVGRVQHGIDFIRKLDKHPIISTAQKV